MENFNVNVDNLSTEEKKQLMTLISRANRRKHSFDKGIYKNGNYFRTEEEAEFELNKRLVYQELKDYALEHNEMSFDWKNGSQLKWVIFYDDQSKCLNYDYWYTHYYIGQIYFYSKETAQEAVKTVGEDRIRKYLFDVN